MSGSRRVIKLGGSLLSMPDLIPSFRAWIVRQPPAANVVIVGGGAAADAVREADHLHRLDETTAHWLCIRMMSVQAEMLAALLPEATLIDDFVRCSEHVNVSGLSVFDVERFLRNDEPTTPGMPLPHGWHVTSDSIAARVAQLLEVDELVMLKSTLPPRGSDVRSLAACGYVDEYFPQAVVGVRRIRCVDLRTARAKSVLVH